MEDEKLVELLDQRFAKVDERFAKVDEHFAKVDERFREAAMNSERLENELKLTNLKVDNLGQRINRLSDEIKLPSGIVAQRFAEVREVIDERNRRTRVLLEKLESKVMATGEQIDTVNEKLDRFRAEVGER